MTDTTLTHSPATAATSEQYALVMLVRDRGNGLERVLGILRRRGPAFSTINVANSEVADTARVTIMVQGSRTAAEHTLEHLRKLVDVRWATVVPAASAAENVVLREFALIRVSCDARNRREVIALAQQFGARVVDVADSWLIVEASGHSDSIEQLISQMRPYGIRELTRTGGVAV